jgi:hypothetical protein
MISYLKNNYQTLSKDLMPIVLKLLQKTGGGNISKFTLQGQRCPDAKVRKMAV